MRKIVEYAATYDTKIAKDFLHWLQSESGYTAEQKKTVLQKAAELFGKIFDKIRELLRDGGQPVDSRQSTVDRGGKVCD